MTRRARDPSRVKHGIFVVFLFLLGAFNPDDKCILELDLNWRENIEALLEDVCEDLPDALFEYVREDLFEILFEALLESVCDVLGSSAPPLCFFRVYIINRIYINK